MTYVYNSRKPNRDYHIGDMSRSLCKLHHSHSWKNIDTVTETPPPDRKLCTTCAHLAARKTPMPKPKKMKQLVNPRGALYKSQEWKRLRYDVLKESNGRCCLCGASAHDGARLNVDHIKPVKTHPQLCLVKANLQVLCGSCNEGKGNRDDTDWREEFRVPWDRFDKF